MIELADIEYLLTKFKDFAPCATPFIIATSAMIAFGMLRRSVRNDLDGRIFALNESFDKLNVVGPIVKAAFPKLCENTEENEKAQIKIQKRVIMMLHMLNLIRGYWSSYNSKVLWILQGA
jgi:hypothetical protein